MQENTASGAAGGASSDTVGFVARIVVDNSPPADTSRNNSSGKAVALMSAASVSKQKKHVSCLISEFDRRRIMNCREDEVWYADSGASRHITCNRAWLSDFQQENSRVREVIFGNEMRCRVEGVGTVKILRLIDGSWVPGVINNVFYVPGIQLNLLSVGACTSNGITAVFVGDYVNFLFEGKLMGTGLKQENDIYRMCF